MTPPSSCPAMSGDTPTLLLSILRELKKISARLELLELIARELEEQRRENERDDIPIPPPPSMIPKRYPSGIEVYPQESEEGWFL